MTSGFLGQRIKSIKTNEKFWHNNNYYWEREECKTVPIIRTMENKGQMHLME